MSDEKPWESFAPAAAPASDKPWESFGGETKPEGKGVVGHLQDTGVSLLKGAVALPEAAVGLTDIVTGGNAGKFLENQEGSIGFRPKQAREFLDTLHTDQYKAQKQEFQDADGILAKTGVALKNPSLITNTVAESAPSMVGGGAIGRAVTMLAPKIAPVIAGALGEGAVMAGSQAESIRQQSEDGLLTPGQSFASVATGGLGTLFGYAGGRMASKLGFGDVDTMLASGVARQQVAGELAKVPSKSIPRQVIEGAVVEGFLEELPQSVAEQVIQNLALDRQWSEGVDEAIVMGTLAGMAMGGPAAGISALSRGAQQEATPERLALPAPVIEVGPDGLATTTSDRNAAMQARRENGGISDVTPVPQAGQQRQDPLALPAPVIEVGPNGEALTSADRNKQLAEANRHSEFQQMAEAARQDRIARGEVLDITPIPKALTESEQMGLDPSVGTMSAAAAMAVDTGATDQLARDGLRQAAAEAAEKNAAKPQGKQSSLELDGVDPETGEIIQPEPPKPEQRAQELTASIDYIRQQAKGMGWTKRLMAARQTAEAELAQINSALASAEPAADAAPSSVQEGIAAVRSERVGADSAPADIKVVIAKQLPQMSDAELQQAATHYAPEHKRTPKIQKEMAKRGIQPSVAPSPATAAQQSQQAPDIDALADTWAKMTKAQRKAVADKTDIKGVLKKNVPNGEWQNMGVAVKTKLATHMAAPAPAVTPVINSQIDSAAHKAATSPTNDRPEPTEAQKEAGNYAKGHVRVNGMDITIENPRGSDRTGKRDDGSEWRHTMSDHYGYIKRTTGADGEHVDTYIGSNPESAKVYVVDQLHQDSGKFDEHKVMLGFDSQDDAVKAYSSNFDKGWKVGQVTEMSSDDFKKWLAEGDTTKPVGASKSQESEQKPQEPSSSSREQAGTEGHEYARQVFDETGSGVAKAVSDALLKLKDAGYKTSVIVREGEAINTLKRRINGFVATDEVGASQVHLFTDSSTRVKIHELLHAALKGWFAKSGLTYTTAEAQQFRTDAEALHKHVSESLQSNAAAARHYRKSGLDKTNLLESAEEMFVGALSDSNAQEFLDLIPYKQESALDRFIGAIASALGISSRNGTAFSELLRVVSPALTPDVPASKAANSESKPEKSAQEQPKAASEPAKSESLDADSRFDNNKIFTADAVAAARARMKKKLGTLNSGIDPELMLDGLTVTGAYIEAGMRDFAAYAKAMVEDFGDGVKPYLLSFWESSRHYPGLDTEGMTSADQSASQHAALLTPEVKEAVAEAVGTVAKKPEKRSKKTGAKGDMVLTQDWGVEHINGYGTESRESGNDTKDAFLKETRSYLNSVADALRTYGFEPHNDGKGKPEKPVSVNESGMAGSGDVSLVMTNPENGNNAYIHVGDTALRGVVPSTPSGIAIMYRVSAGSDRYASKGGNTWAPVDLSASDLARLVSGSARPAAATEENSNARTSQTRGVSGANQAGAESNATPGGGDRQPVATGLANAREGADRAKPVSGSPENAGGTGTGGLQQREQSPSAPRDSGDVRPESRAAATVTPSDSDPAVSETSAKPELDRDFDLAGQDIGKGGLTKKYRENIASIRILKAMAAEGRQATPEERKQIARYVGWGALKGVFDPANKQWATEYAELKELLTDAEYKAARASTLNAHYTSPQVVGSIYQALERMGFTSGRVIEPSVGTGNFFGLMPSGMRKKSQLHGVELDPLTSQIAAALYPSAKISKATGFQDFDVPAEYFDLAIGNPPFGSEPLVDAARSPYSGSSIHNYFFAKSIDKLRPGGLLTMVVSHNFLDAKNEATRRWIADRADLVGAVRLPNTAFKENAGTEVVTDILVFQKRGADQPAAGHDAWVSTSEIDLLSPKTGEKSTHRVSSYFTANPRTVLGRPTAAGSMYRADEYTVEPNGNLTEQLADWAKSLPANIYQPVARTHEMEAADIAIPDGVKVGSFFMDGDKVQMRGNDVMGNRTATAWTPPNAKAAVRMKGMVGLRDSLRTQMRLERSPDSTVEQIEENRTALRESYEAFKKQHGYLNDQTNRRIFLDDTESSLLLALEFDYDKGVSRAVADREDIDPRPPTAVPADILNRRVMFPPADNIRVSNAKDALLASLNYKGTLDLPYMATLYDKTESAILKELGDVVYADPINGVVMADEYLSGDVKTKLAEAEAAVLDNPEYKRNVEALRKVIPADKRPSEIHAALGASFIPAEYFKQFAKEITGADTEMTYIKATGQWIIGEKSSPNPTLNVGKWGISKMPATAILSRTMAGQGVVVTEVRKDASGTTTVVLERETEAAREKQTAIKAEWQRWLWSDADRAEKVAAIYNEKMNRLVVRKFDGSHMTFPGMSPAITLLDHQKAAVWRGLQSRQVLLDHVVGAGKTFELVALFMEMRRLGIARKPFIAVPNHLTLQWRSEFSRLYPSANVLAATPDDFAKGNREKFFSKIVTGDWDAVIVGHSSLKKIGLPAETEKAVLQEQLDDIAAAIEEVKRGRGDRNIIRDMEGIKARLDAKLKTRLQALGERDKVLTFDELGIDAMAIDELHEFKNLFYNSTMERVPGMGNPSGSDKAFDLFVKMQWMFDTYGEKAPIAGATGTPVSNSLVEMFNMQRFLQYPTLKREGLNVFDAWAKQFGSVESLYEVSPSGTGYRQSSRFAKFKNLPALMAHYQTFADTVTLDDLKAQEVARGKAFPVPKVAGGRPQNIVAKRSPQVSRFMGVPELDIIEGEVQFAYNAASPTQRASIERAEDGEAWKATIQVSDPNGKGYPTLLGAAKTEEDARLMVVEAALTPKIKVDPKSILGQFANLKQLNRESKGKVNALSLTGQANKAGLDYRLINPSAPDFPGSKINLAVDRVVDVYQRWSADKGAQLVFCDLSVPLSARSGFGAKERRVYVRDAGEITHKRGTLHTVAGHEDVPYLLVKESSKDGKSFAVYDAATGLRIHGGSPSKAIATDWVSRTLNDEAKLQRWIDARDALGDMEQDAIDDYNSANEIDTEETEAITLSDIAGVSGSQGFSVYDDIKAKLIAKGIPEREVAFIHDYSTPTAKAKLFTAVNNGDIRVVLGSTPKMGAGTNVQKRLVGLHHIDAPWRPSDLEQREGRIIRRGNVLYDRDPDGFEVEIFRYATEQTYDTRRWQILEHKARGIEQLRNYDDSINEIDDIEGEAANSADMKAAASGDPLILEETQLRNDVRRLESLQASHADERQAMMSRARNETRFANEWGPRDLAQLQAVQSAADKHPESAKGGFAGATIAGKNYTDREEAIKAIKAAMDRVFVDGGSEEFVFRGVTFSLDGDDRYSELTSPTGRLDTFNVTKDALPSAAGFLTRFANYISRVPAHIQDVTAKIERAKVTAAAFRSQADGTFDQADDLTAAREAHKRVQRRLIAKGPDIPVNQKAQLAAAMEKQRAALTEQGYGGAMSEFMGANADRVQFSRGKSLTDTQAFKRWFGDSKVVDAKGKPLVVYHGSKADISEFSSKFNRRGEPKKVQTGGLFFTPDRGLAQTYAGDGAVYPVYVRIANPMPYEVQNGGNPKGVGGYNRNADFPGGFDVDDPADVDKAEKLGYDGILNGGNELIAFRPEQIKSAIGNNGQFDPANPDIRYSFAGKSANGADMLSLATAQQQVNAGYDAERVRQDTGWHRGNDGKWRFEISDNQASLTPEGTNFASIRANAILDKGGDGITVGDVLAHDRLYAAYPHLRDLPIGIVPEGETATAKFKLTATGPQIQVSPRLRRDRVASAIIHELQHGIQAREGFARGGTKKGIQNYEENGADVYQRLAGEVEARNTQARLLLNDQFRQMTPPSMTADVAYSDVIVTFNGRDVVNAPAPENVNVGQSFSMTPQALSRAFDVQFPSLAPAVRKMLKKGQKGERGGVVVIGSADPVVVARTFAKKTGRSFDQAVQSLGGEGTINGFYDPKSGLTFMVGPNLDPVTAPAVLLHEMTHGQQRKKIDQAALAMIMERGTAAPDLRAFLDRVAARMVDADETANAMEAAAYIVEQAVIEGRSQGYTLADSRFLNWVDSTLGKRVGDFLRSFIANVRQWMLRNGLPIGQMTVDDLVSYAMAGIERAAEGDVNALTSSEVSPSRDSVANTPAFKRWFGDSKVVDDQGKPLVVYHGTEADIGAFHTAPVHEIDRRRMGAYFSASSDFAGLYGASRISAYLSLTNPLDIRGLDAGSAIDALPVEGFDKKVLRSVFRGSDYSQYGLLESGNQTKLRAALEAAGYDGVIYQEGGSDAFIAFRPEQIKSATGNNGQFDPANPDIRFSRSGVKALASRATAELNKTFGAPGKLSKWHTTVGTMYNLAKRSPAFKPVFESAQGFIEDVAYYAADASELAPKLLPKLETWKDITKSPVSAEDNKAVGKPIFEGTLVWARDLDGKPVRVESLTESAANLTADEKADILIANEKLPSGLLKAWKALGEEKFAEMIDSRYESQMLKAGIVWSDAELRSMFKLTDGQIELYHEFRNATNRSLDTMARSDMLRYGGDDVKDLRQSVMDAPDAAAGAKLLRDHLMHLSQSQPGREAQLAVMAHGMMERADRVADLQTEGYAPLSRFGKYTVDVVVNGDRQYFSLFETQRDANNMAERMRKEFGADSVSQGTLSDESFKLFAGITPESLELFGNMLGLNSTGDEAKDQAFQDYLRLTKTNRSAMRRLIHRQGIAGFSEDVGRVLASFVYSNARQTAAGLHMGDMGEALTAIPKEQGELKDAAIRLSEYIKNPQEEAQAVRGLLFAQYLGGSVASAFVNMTQPFAVTFPWLSQHGGAKKAAAELGKAAKHMSTKGYQYESDLAAALKVAEDDGIVSPQEVHQLMAQARGSGSLRSGDGTKFGDAKAVADNSIARLSVAWGKLFGAAEQVNRRITFIAAYRMAKDKGMQDPAAFARESVRETQFIYSKASKMQWGRGAVGGTLMTFKTYSVAYLELMSRLWSQGEPGSQERKDGRKAAMLMIAMLMLMGGAGGLPFAEDAEDLIDGAAQLMGYNFSAKKAKEQFLIDVFGDDIARFVDKGISGLPGAPLDVSGRLGMGNLLPGTGLFQERTDHSRDILEIAGPAGDFAKRVLTGGRQILGGDVGSGLLEMSPTAVRNAAKGVDMAITDMYRDTKGYKVLETSHLEAALKAVGFQPSGVARVQESNWLNQRSKAYYNMKAQEIRSMWAAGIFEKDQGKVQDARNAVAEWNEKNPDQKMLIRIPDIMRRVREMSKDKDQRIADTAPRAMRAQMREESSRLRSEMSE